MLVAAKYLLTIVVSGFYCLHTLAQVVDVSGLEKGAGYIFFNGQAERLKNSSIITLDSVLKPSSQKRFQRFPDRTVIFHGYDPYYYWYRFQVRNNDSIPKQAMLLFGGKGVRTAELWQRDTGWWYSHGRTGYKYSFDQRFYPFSSYYYPVSVPAHCTSSFYIDVDESHAYKTISLALFDPSQLEKIKSRFYYVFGIFTGMLFLFALLNIYLFFSLKEKIHIWYSLYVLFSLMFIIKHEGLDMQFLGMDSEQAYRASSMAGFAAVGSGFLVHVVQLFLTNIGPRTVLTLLMKIVKWSLWASGICFFVVFYIEPVNTVEVIVFEWANKSTLAAIFIILIACIYSIRKGFKPAWLLLLGQLFFLLGGLLRTLFVGDLSHVIPPAPFQTGLLLEVFIISFALMYRYNHFKTEKDSLAEQLKAQHLKIGTQLLMTQENERKRIAEDLHDELGGNLAAIKMALQSFELPGSQGELLIGLIDKASVNARNIAHNLMPPDFEMTGLVEMLKPYYQHQTAEGKVHFHFYVSGQVNVFNRQEELMIYRILMELTNNIYKHSNATEATVQLVNYDNYLEVMVEDNGTGFSGEQNDGIGLKNIRSRVDYLNGMLSVDTGKKGTTIIIRIPYKMKYEKGEDNNSR